MFCICAFKTFPPWHFDQTYAGKILVELYWSFWEVYIRTCIRWKNSVDDNNAYTQAHILLRVRCGEHCMRVAFSHAFMLLLSKKSILVQIHINMFICMCIPSNPTHLHQSWIQRDAFLAHSKRARKLSVWARLRGLDSAHFVVDEHHVCYIHRGRYTYSNEDFHVA